MGLPGERYGTAAGVELSTEAASTLTHKPCMTMNVGSTIISVYFVVTSGRAKVRVGIICICHVVNVSAGGIAVRSSMLFSALYVKVVPHTLKEPAGELQYALMVPALIETFHGAPALSMTPTLRASAYTEVPLSRATLPRIGWLTTTFVPLLLKVPHAFVAAGVIGDTSGGHAWAICAAK